MADDAQAKPSFSLGRKWGIGLDVAVRSALVLAVLVMLNYLSGRYYERLFLSSQTRIQLSPRTVSVLKTVTNRLDVTLYYDKDDPFFTTVSGLLNEYRSANQQVHVEAVDPVRDSSRAAEIISKYKDYDLAVVTNKNLVIFDYEGRVKVAPGNLLIQYQLEQVPNTNQLEFIRRPVAFMGETMFTAYVLAVLNPKPLHACFLVGHGEHSPDNDHPVLGYTTFASILRQNYVQVHSLSLLGTNAVPMECNVLIIAGPTNEIPSNEVERIEQYLRQGGRLLALRSPLQRVPDTGLETILAAWGVRLGADPVRDPDNSQKGSDVVVSAFGHHPIVNPLADSGLSLHLSVPRPVDPLAAHNPPADAPRVEAIAFSGPHASLAGDPAQRQGRFPLVATVEKGAVPGVVTAGGSTRIVAVGDSIFLGNTQIKSAANNDFAASAINWLLNRPELVQGIGPRRITEFRLALTRARLQTVQWILLAGLPGGVLLLGGLVWLRRRK